MGRSLAHWGESWWAKAHPTVLANSACIEKFVNRRLTRFGSEISQRADHNAGEHAAYRFGLFELLDDGFEA